MAWMKDVYKKPKYGNRRTTHPDGSRFASALECAVYCVLLMRERCGELKDIKKQHRVDMIHRKRPRSWKVDFSATVVATGKTLWIEAKGSESNKYLVDLKAWEKDGPGDLEIWKGSWQRPYLKEVRKGGRK